MSCPVVRFVLSLCLSAQAILALDVVFRQRPSD
eukprot:COSAG06_NODE_29432_length_556_cov_1.466083_1_plen_32_part_10